MSATRVLEACRPYLGTYVMLRVALAPESMAVAEGLDVLAAGFAAFERVQASMSRFERDSDVSRLNRAAAGACLEVDRWTWEVLRLSQDLYKKSSGCFDCGALGLRRGAVPSSIANLSLMDVSPSCWSPTASAAGSERAWVRVDGPVALNLGGIAKGYAVDQALAALRSLGATQVQVNAGGDLAVFGPEAVMIHVRDPNDPRRVRCAGSLRDGACASSAPYFRDTFLASNDTAGAHLLDPRSGETIARSTSYTVIAPSCALADGLTKVVAVLGPEAQVCLDRYGAYSLNWEALNDRDAASNLAA